MALSSAAAKWPRRASIGLAFILLATGSAAAPIGASAATGTTISGVITLAGDPAPAGSVEVVLRRFSGGDPWQFVDTVVSVSEDGSYAFRGLAPGSYDVRFDHRSGGYGDEWLSGVGASDSDRWLSVNTAPVVANVDLEPSAVMSGRVRDAVGRVVAGVTVTAEFFAEGWWGYHPSRVSTTSDANGYYRLVGLTPGRTQVTFAKSGYPTQGYGQEPYGPIDPLITTSPGTSRTLADMVLFKSNRTTVTIECSTYGCSGLAPGDYWIDIQKLVPGPRWQQVSAIGFPPAQNSYGTLVATSTAQLIPGKYRAFVRFGGDSARAYSPPVDLVDGGDLRLSASFRPFVRGDYLQGPTADVLARMPDGTLRVYAGNGRGSWDGSYVHGSGWGGFTSVFSAGDFETNLATDVLARTTDGRLVLYPRTPWGSWGTARVVGSGWQGFTAIFSPGDFNGDGTSDVIARAANGDLYLYPGNGGGGWLLPRKIGTGWAQFTSVFAVGDFDGDGAADIMGRRSNGDLYLYSGDGWGGWKGWKRIGVGWQFFTEIVGPGDFDGDGAMDVMGKQRDGRLILYPGNGQGGWSTAKVVGWGWQSLRIVG
ncbi:carboxypeptidase regulatory-like domain-containing protein [Microbacterium sp.]|uniref:carboxypeptidase regulatory-like domain-containing protein n=1 Tax=Microbacterium sp. TaxID=51671 RepID=UPI003F6F3808